MSLFSRLFGARDSAREHKRSRAGAMLALHTIGNVRWTPRDYVALTREGFERNAIVHRCVRMIAESVATIPWRFYEGADEIVAHPLIDLLARPNPTDTTTDFIESLVTNLLLFGNAYVEGAQIDGNVREIYSLRADRMSVVPGPSGWPSAFDYVFAGDRVRYEMTGQGVEPILHVKLAHPLDDHYGLPPLAAAHIAIDTHNAAGFWNKALLDNSARPSGALVYGANDGAQFTDAQFDRLKSELEESFSGSSNAGHPLLLDGGLDWKALSLSPKDMDFTEAKAAAAREIALCFGVPPLVLGLPGDNTRANYAEANSALWRGAIIPMVARLQRAFEHWLKPAWPALRIDYDIDRIDALASERAAEWTRVDGATFLTTDEKREALGYGALAKGEGAAPMPGDPPPAPAPEVRYAGQPRTDDGRFDFGGMADPGGYGTPAAERDAPKKPADVQVAQNDTRRPGSIPLRIGQTFEEATPAQAARLEAARGLAEAATAKVREIDPKWKEEPSMSEGVEGAIAREDSLRQQAVARYRALQDGSLTKGQYACVSIPARDSGRNFSTAEHEEINQIGRVFGCHTCGTTDPGTKSGNFVLDHQPVTALNWRGLPQRLFPQCLACMYKQGGNVRSLQRSLDDE